MSIFTAEILALAKTIRANCATWGVDDDGKAYVEFNGERETAPVAAKSKSGWLDPMFEAHEQANRALEQRLGRRIEYHRFDRSHPYGG